MSNLTELFEQHPQLAVITATRRLSRRLLHDYNQQQVADGLKAWPTPDILSWSAWVQRQWQEGALQGATGEALLNTTQSLQLWQSVIEAESDGLLNAEATARQSHNARQLVIDYALDLSDQGNQSLFVYDADASRWLDWHQQYERKLTQSGWLDAPAVTHLLIERIINDELKPAGPLCFMGFDAFTPLQWKLLNYLGKQELLIEPLQCDDQQAQSALFCAKDATDEIKQAAYWARQQFETNWQEGDQPVGIIFPKLEQQRQQVERIFREVFYPQDGLSDIDTNISDNFHTQGIRESSVFNLSLGYSLKQEPLIATALNILSLCQYTFAYDTYSQVLRSPYIKDAKEKIHQRSALDFTLRKTTPAEITLHGLLSVIPEDSGDLAKSLTELSQLKDNWKGKAKVQAWVDCLRQSLGLFGWPNVSGNDSYSFQVMQSFDEVLFDCARMDVVQDEVSLDSALSILNAAINNKVFQSGAGELPIQILGMLESAGINFSSLWVTGMTEQNWPQPANPNPFIPIRLQREHNMPHSSPQHEYDYARHQTQRLNHAADQIVFSYPQQSENNETFMPSPLVALCPLIEISFVPEQAFDDAPMETLLDEQGPPVDVNNYQAGTGAIKDQAACPFRAFVQHRLKSRLPEELQPGNDPRIRGELVHRVMEALWRQWRSSDQLHALDQEQLTRSVQQVVEKVVQTQAWRINVNHQIEQQRLVKLVMEWLTIEKQRQPFEVVGFELETHYQINQLKLDMRIDRIDELADGSCCVIDYKTGEAKSSQWTSERPDEPQVPLYALSQEQTINAVAFANIKAGESKYEGATSDRVLMATEEKTLPGIKQIPIQKGASALKEYEDWEGMLEAWQINLNTLAAAHVSGDAAVDPKSWPTTVTCNYCDVKPVCRLFAWDGEEVV